MSKNIVDAVIEYSRTYKIDVTFIPSRRQIDKSAGYVNGWTTKSFCEYVRSKQVSTIHIQRDHGGPGQGDIDDDGIDSLLEDCLYMDSLHIDPWKRYPIYEEGLEWTIRLIKTCYAKNPEITYEVGTEEGIRPFSTEMLEKFCSDLRNTLPDSIFKKIKFIVIQCGTQLLEKENIGTYDEEKLSKMLSIVSSYGLKAKEHNGDWVPQSVILLKEALGLRHMNIAPEFGELETKVALDMIGNNQEDFDLFYRLCLDSGRWKKWVSTDFDPDLNKKTLILIAGHYVFSNPMFISMISHYPLFNFTVRQKIQEKLHELHNVFKQRIACIFCKSKDLDVMFKKEKQIAMSYALLPKQNPGYFIPYNIQHCKSCHSFQTKYIGDLSLVYSVNHIDNFGAVKSRMHEYFASFILENQHVMNTVEIGACHDYLSRLLLSKRPKTTVHIVDPFFTGNTEGLIVVPEYLEKIDLQKLPVNTVLMSSVFEHFYNPREVLEKLQTSSNIQFIYINHPEMEYSIKNDIYINLTTEHTFYIENRFLIDLFRQYGFCLTKQSSFETHTTCFEFTRKVNLPSFPLIQNLTSLQDIKKYILRLDQKVRNMNTFMEENPDYEYYVWPASMHLTPIFTHGFHTEKIKGLLDNSPNKIGKFFYGYNLPCFSFTDIVSNATSKTCVFLGGSPAYRKELMLQNNHCKFYEI